MQLQIAFLSDIFPFFRNSSRQKDQLDIYTLKKSWTTATYHYTKVIHHIMNLFDANISMASGQK